jgi:hypothetical protein
MHVTRLLHASSTQLAGGFLVLTRLYTPYTPLTRLSHAAGGLLVLNIPIAYASERGIKDQRDLGVQAGEGDREKELLGGSRDTGESETNTRHKEEEEVCKVEEKDQEEVAEEILPILQALRTSGGGQRKVLVYDAFR